MTHEEMVEELRRYGYKVQLPLDMRRAGPWVGADDSWQRNWEGTALTAAHVCSRGPSKKGYVWHARLIGFRGYSSPRGFEDSPEEAMAAADLALLQLLREARKRRLASLEGSSSALTFSGSLGLDPLPDEA